MSSQQKSGMASSESLATFHHNYHLNSSMSSNFEPPKKKRVRARLDHLSPNEKLQRRKLKNRVAAQTARDRKRAKIDHLQEENRKLREENELLKSQIKGPASSGIASSPTSLTDSGFNEGGSTPKTQSSSSIPGCMAMDLLAIPHDPVSPGSSSGFYSVTPEPEINNEYIDSVVGETDEATLIDDILQLQETIFSEHGNDVTIGSAELINAPQQQVQETSCQLPSVENSAGWTSIQLMLLLLISRVHKHFSLKTNCCAMIHEANTSQSVGAFSNLYDYILQTKCIDFRRAAEAIISNKNNVRQQRLVALEFVHTYLYNNRIQRNQKYKAQPELLKTASWC